MKIEEDFFNNEFTCCEVNLFAYHIAVSQKYLLFKLIFFHKGIFIYKKKFTKGYLLFSRNIHKLTLHFLYIFSSNNAKLSSFNPLLPQFCFLSIFET